jgi:hypothetical protein
MAATDPNASLEVLQDLLAHVPAVSAPSEASVRLGDVYALVIKTYACSSEWSVAGMMLQDMLGQGLPPERFLDSAVLAAVCANTGIAPAETHAQQRPATGPRCVSEVSDEDIDRGGDDDS